MIIAIGTENKAKLSAVEQAFKHLAAYSSIKFEGISAPSLVSEQPFDDEETLLGAINRASFAQQSINASIGIGLEGGVVETSNGLYICNWGALCDPLLPEPITAGGARLRLPDQVAEQLREGRELGPVMEEFSQKKEIRQREGAVGLFTNERVTRAAMFSHIVTLLIGQWEYKRTN
ncbi:DUF84 family protein [Jeotgalibacillus sp. S-D1]|nr:DUF84 family protein [Jeotgalibacillus sp. S-D1]